VRHGQMNAEIACYVLARYMYLVESNLRIPDMANEQVQYAFKRFLPNKFEEFKGIVKQPDKLVAFFDREIAKHHGAARQRVTEMALEVTHQKNYWTLLENQFNGRYEGYEYAYRYGIEWQLI